MHSAPPPCTLPRKAELQRPSPYPALCFLDLSDTPSRAMSLLKTMIPMSMFTWGPGWSRAGEERITRCPRGKDTPRWELKVREKAEGNDDPLGPSPSLDVPGQ